MLLTLLKFNRSHILKQLFLFFNCCDFWNIKWRVLYDKDVYRASLFPKQLTNMHSNMHKTKFSCGQKIIEKEFGHQIFRDEILGSKTMMNKLPEINCRVRIYVWIIFFGFKLYVRMLCARNSLGRLVKAGNMVYWKYLYN